MVIQLIDAKEGISDQDLQLLGYIIDSGRALVIAINKWDGMDDYDKRRLKESLQQRLVFIKFAEIFYISALHGTGVGHLYKAINKSYAAAMRKLSTPLLTRILDKATTEHQLPLVHGRRVKLRYAHQGGMNPPIIVIHGNQTELVPASYKRYLTNLFMDELNIQGTPMRLEFKTGSNPYQGRQNKLSDRQIKRKRRLIKHVKKNERKKKRRD